MKIDLKVFKEEYKKNIKEENKRYGKRFRVILFIILFLYSIMGRFFDNALMYSGICVIIIYTFIVVWDYSHPKK